MEGKRPETETVVASSTTDATAAKVKKKPPVTYKDYQSAIVKRRKASARAAEARYAMYMMRRKSKAFSQWTGIWKGKKEGVENMNNARTSHRNKRMALARKTAEQRWSLRRKNSLNFS